MTWAFNTPVMAKLWPGLRSTARLVWRVTTGGDGPVAGLIGSVEVHRLDARDDPDAQKAVGQRQRPHGEPDAELGYLGLDAKGGVRIVAVPVSVAIVLVAVAAGVTGLTDRGEGIAPAEDEVGVPADSRGHRGEADDVEIVASALVADERGRIRLVVEDVDGDLVVAVEVAGLAFLGVGDGVAGGLIGLDNLDVEDDLGPLGLGDEGEDGEEGEG